MFHKMRSQQGFTIVEVMVSFALLSILVYSVATFYKSYQDQEVVARTRATTLQIRQNVLGLLSNQEAWNRTVSRVIQMGGSKMDCLNPNLTVYCTPGDNSSMGGPDPLPIFDAMGTKIIDEAPTAGFTLNGGPCNTFDAVNGNDSCPIRVEVHWTAACVTTRTDGKCWIPQSLIDVNFRFSAKNIKSINAMNGLNDDRYNFRGISRVDLDTKCGILCDCVKNGGIPLFQKPGWLGPDSGGGDICIPITSLKGPPA